MRKIYWVSALYVLIAFLYTPVFAQTMDMSELKALEEGNYTFVKGKVQVTLADTTTPDFITREFERMGYEITNLDITPIIAFARVEQLSDSVVSILKQHPYVNEVIAHNSVFGEMEKARIMNNEDLSEERKQALIKELEKRSMETELRIFFEPEVTVEMAKKLDARFSSFTLELMDNLPRSVIVKTEEDKETEVMDVLDGLPYVQYTALIGVIGDN